MRRGSRWLIVAAQACEVAASRRVEQIVPIAATIGEAAIVSRASFYIASRTVWIEAMLPARVGSGPAAGISDRYISVIAVFIPAAQDRQLAVLDCSIDNARLHEREIPGLPLCFGLCAYRVVEWPHRCDPLPATRHPVRQRRRGRQVGEGSPYSGELLCMLKRPSSR